MSWVHDSGYQPAYAHIGYPVAVQVDGSETASSSAASSLEVIGWRSACDCGWRGTRFYSRGEWPSVTAAAPDAVDGWEDGTATFVEWRSHLDRVLPELAVHDIAQQLVEVEDRLALACQAARFAGLSWAHITRAAGGHAAVGSARRSETSGRTPPAGPRSIALSRDHHTIHLRR